MPTNAELYAWALHEWLIRPKTYAGLSNLIPDENGPAGILFVLKLKKPIKKKGRNWPDVLIEFREDVVEVEIGRHPKDRGWFEPLTAAVFDYARADHEPKDIARWLRENAGLVGVWREGRAYQPPPWSG